MGGVEVTDYGYRLTLSEFADTGEVTALLQEIRRRLRTQPESPSAVLVDLRCTRALPAETQERFRSCFTELAKAGVQRQALVVSSPITLLQARRLMREAGVGPLCRYFDPASEPEWELFAVQWLAHGIEPPEVDDLPEEENGGNEGDDDRRDETF
ncbi:MAG TPA: hypothetical protein VMW27_22755 [Thermoanaerobaculia bacterium]|nr:hypothetical protein [Thermoanaerobaculia bacterium]